MEPWDVYVQNFTTEEIEQLDQDYGWHFEGVIKKSTRLQRFTIDQIEIYLFHSNHRVTDFIPRDDEDIQRALGRPARIFQIGMEKKPEDYVAILEAIRYWATDNMRMYSAEAPYAPLTDGLRPFLEKLKEFEAVEDAKLTDENFEHLQKILFVPD